MESSNTIWIIRYIVGDSVKVAHVTMRIKTGNINVDDIQTGK